MTQKQIKSLYIALFIFLGLILWSASHAQIVWKYFATGIEELVIHRKIHVFKISQDLYSFKAKGDSLNSKILPQWTKEETGGINLNMFVVGSIPRGYTRIDGETIQPKFKADYNGFIVWNNKQLTILDRTEESLDSIMSWPNVSQNIRMMKRGTKDKNRWQKEYKKWSVSTIATTTDGDVLLIHSRYPLTMHEFNIYLINHSRWLKIDRMVYLEGGPESGIVVKGLGSTFSQMGSYETDFNENDENNKFWPIPWALTFNIK